MKKLVFLHIEKAAGTSQRVLFYQTFGKENVYWYGTDPNRNKFLIEDVRQLFIIGGHKRFDFYQRYHKNWFLRLGALISQDSEFYSNDGFGYMAVVREPIERVISFFQYCRTKEYQRWSEHGLDPNSLHNTLRESRPFRRAIENRQCRYLSGFGSFEKTKKNISRHKFVVGSLARIELFNEYLVKNIECVDRALDKVNAGSHGYKEDIDIDDQLKQEITDLVSEDIKLYTFINDDCGGLFDNISHSDWDTFNSTVSAFRLDG